MSFGAYIRTAERERTERQVQAEIERREAVRCEQKCAFEDFCARQQERVRATLKKRTDRIQRARWGDCEGDGSHFVVSRKGSTETSAPVRRSFQEQR